MKIIIKITLVIIIVVFYSLWYFLHSDLYLKNKISSSEWSSHVDVHGFDEEIEHVVIRTNTKFLPNKMYFKNSKVTLVAKDTSGTLELEFFENGTWDIYDKYLTLNLNEIESNPLKEFEIKDSDYKKYSYKSKSIFIRDSGLSKRVDILSRNSILLTDLNGNSRVIF
ncbi:hypothetical protein BA894_01200 [Vibrio natriegens]|uniref:regulatory protein ToxS n=1 Tax=Vibrio natriegens TaxID=691 RepID=UPI00080418D3|nr:regulatory protein ToxS [Vibrio natriegens]ANQ25150.1 hypothetical protein BA894_01200 [Vibrio natriegens]